MLSDPRLAPTKTRMIPPAGAMPPMSGGSGMVFRVSLRTSTGPTSTMATVSESRPRLNVSWPAALVFRTHLTSPDGATSRRMPSASTNVMTGVEYIRPLRRPRTIKR
jgi:hypothetical protein